MYVYVARLPEASFPPALSLSGVLYARAQTASSTVPKYYQYSGAPARYSAGFPLIMPV